MAEGIIDSIMQTLKGIEKDEATLTTIEGGKKVELFNSEQGMFDSFVELWQNPEKRKEYEALKGDLGEKYMTDPARFVGFLEDSPEMHKDVIAAANETGINPAFLYNVAMQEGMGEERSKLAKRTFPDYYDSDRPKHTYGHVGLDAFFGEQDKLLESGYLNTPIKPLEDFGKVESQQNEQGMSGMVGTIASKDVWRGIGALLRQNRDYMVNTFNNRDIDFDSLPENIQQFWIYASFNAGAGEAAKLLEAYGSNPLENDAFKSQIDLYTGANYPFTAPEEAVLPLGEWMENVGRVIGGTELTKMYSPFSNQY